MSDNWVVQNLQNALDTWNSKLAEIWQILTQSPETFKGGGIWQVIVQIHGALQAIGYALLVLFFVVGVVKTCGSFTEVKRPEHALKIFIRFAITKGVVTYGLELMMALFNIIQGVTSTIMQTAGFGSTEDTVLPDEIIEAVEDCGFFESIPLWAVTLIGGLFITVLMKRMMDACYLAQRIRGMLPPLPAGVTPAYIHYLDIIEMLEKQGVRAKISDISDALDLPRPGVTRTVKAMEAKGYLKKAASSEDGRITYLSLTEAGRELSRIYNEQFFTTLTSFMEDIPEEDVKCTIRTIDAVHQIMCDRRPDLDKCKK